MPKVQELDTLLATPTVRQAGGLKFSAVTPIKHADVGGQIATAVTQMSASYEKAKSARVTMAVTDFKNNQNKAFYGQDGYLRTPAMDVAQPANGIPFSENVDTRLKSDIDKAVDAVQDVYAKEQVRVALEKEASRYSALAYTFEGEQQKTVTVNAYKDSIALSQNQISTGQVSALEAYEQIESNVRALRAEQGFDTSTADGEGAIAVTTQAHVSAAVKDGTLALLANGDYERASAYYLSAVNRGLVTTEVMGVLSGKVEKARLIAYSQSAFADVEGTIQRQSSTVNKFATVAGGTPEQADETLRMSAGDLNKAFAIATFGKDKVSSWIERAKVMNDSTGQNTTTWKAYLSPAQNKVLDDKMRIYNEQAFSYGAPKLTDYLKEFNTRYPDATPEERKAFKEMLPTLLEEVTARTDAEQTATADAGLKSIEATGEISPDVDVHKLTYKQNEALELIKKRSHTGDNSSDINLLAQLYDNPAMLANIKDADWMLMQAYLSREEYAQFDETRRAFVTGGGMESKYSLAKRAVDEACVKYLPELPKGQAGTLLKQMFTMQVVEVAKTQPASAGVKLNEIAQNIVGLKIATAPGWFSSGRNVNLGELDISKIDDDAKDLLKAYVPSEDPSDTQLKGVIVQALVLKNLKYLPPEVRNDSRFVTYKNTFRRKHASVQITDEDLFELYLTDKLGIINVPRPARGPTTTKGDLDDIEYGYSDTEY